MCTCFCVCAYVKVRGWGDWPIHLKTLSWYLFFFSLSTHTTCADTPTAGILHTQAQWEPGVEPRNGAPAGGASSWPKSIYEKPCKYNRIITLTGLRRLQYTVWLVCVCEGKCTFVSVLWHLLSPSCWCHFLKQTFFDIITAKRRGLSVCIFITGSVASSVVFSLAELNSTMQLHTSEYRVSNMCSAVGSVWGTTSYCWTCV